MKKPWKKEVAFSKKIKLHQHLKKKQKTKDAIEPTTDENDSSITETQEKEAKDEGRRSGPLSLLIDIGIAFGLIALIFFIMYLYTGNWPPMVVVESSSMAHGYGYPPESSIGVIDTGDLVWVKEIDDKDDVVSYLEGKEKSKSTYGDYGDVIIYLKNGVEDTPVIHRAVAWIEFNKTYTVDDGEGTPDIIHTFDVPHYEGATLYNVTQFTIYDYGWQHLNITFDLLQLDFSASGKKPHSGFITLGDHNNIQYDQRGLADARGYRVEPVKPEWVMGKARGEIPWMGIIRLYFMGIRGFPSNSVRNMFITLGVIIAIPICIEVAGRIYSSRYAKTKTNEKDMPTEEKNDDDLASKE